MSDLNRMISLACLIKELGVFAYRANVFEGDSVQDCTLAFIEEYKGMFKDAGFVGESGVDTLHDFFNGTHSKSSQFNDIISLVSKWNGRIDDLEEKKIRANSSGKYPLLQTPFSDLATESKAGGINVKYVYGLQTFGRSDSIFPTNVDTEVNQDAYKKAWSKFVEDFKKLPTVSSEAFLYSIFHLLKIHLWYVPLIEDGQAKTSLFESARLTAALASSLFQFREIKSNAAETNDDFPFLLLCGDISGIQTFIYNISNKSAMKGLKGRSFYVQLLAESISSEILAISNVTICNQVYAAGGKFYLLLPNTNNVREKISEYKESLETQLWDQHKGKLSVNIASIAFRFTENVHGIQQIITEDDVNSEQHIGQLWSALSTKTSLQKRKRFSSLITDDFESFFKPSGVGGKIRVCSVSGEELYENVAELDNEDIEQEGSERLTSAVSQAVKDQIAIGKSLYKASVLMRLNGNTNKGLSAGAHSVWAIENDDTYTTSEVRMVMDWNGDQIPLFPYSTQYPCGYGFRFYGGIRMAIHPQNSRIKTLEEICYKNPEDNKGENETDKLGVLRLDVDNLGNLFMNGFKHEVNGKVVNTSNFTSLSMLSVLLDQFFSGYLNTIRDTDDFKDYVNIVYSGGDDVFAVGRWDKVLAFSVKIREAFRKFVCGREDISLSGGLAIVRPKFPIAKASDIAGEMEDEAKTSTYEIDSKKYIKDSLSVLGVTLNWTYEIPFVLECKNDLVKWIKEEKILSKGILMKMFDYYNLFLKNKIEWRWQSAYMITRAARESQDARKKEVLDIIKTLLFTHSYKNKYTAIRFSAFVAACRWAELELKNNN